MKSLKQSQTVTTHFFQLVLEVLVETLHPKYNTTV